MNKVADDLQNWLPHINVDDIELVKKLVIEKFKQNNINGWVKLGDLVEEWQINTNDVIVTDNYLNCKHVSLWPQFYGTYFLDQEYKHIPPTKTVSFFINRTDAFRQSWLYQIVRRNLFNDAHFSYHCYVLNEAFDNQQKPANEQEVFEYFYQYNTIFEKEHEFLKHRVPLKTFSGTVEQAILESKISLVLETYHDSNYGVALSEKTFRNLQIPRPFLIFSNPGTIEHLQRCGFDCFDDIVDHSYDKLQSEVDRQAMIFDEIEKFRSIEYDQKLIDRLLKGCNNNKKLLRQLQIAWPSKLKSVLTHLNTMKQENNELR